MTSKGGYSKIRIKKEVLCSGFSDREIRVFLGVMYLIKLFQGY